MKMPPKLRVPDCLVQTVFPKSVFPKPMLPKNGISKNILQENWAKISNALGNKNLGCVSQGAVY